MVRVGGGWDTLPNYLIKHDDLGKNRTVHGTATKTSIGSFNTTSSVSDNSGDRHFTSGNLRLQRMQVEY